MKTNTTPKSLYCPQAGKNIVAKPLVTTAAWHNTKCLPKNIKAQVYLLARKVTKNDMETVLEIAKLHGIGWYKESRLDGAFWSVKFRVHGCLPVVLVEAATKAAVRVNITRTPASVWTRHLPFFGNWDGVAWTKEKKELWMVQRFYFKRG